MDLSILNKSIVHNYFSKYGFNEGLVSPCHETTEKVVEELNCVALTHNIDIEFCVLEMSSSENESRIGCKRVDEYSFGVDRVDLLEELISKAGITLDGPVAK